MPLFSREMLLRKVKEGRVAKVLGTAAAGSGLAAAVLMASSPDAVLKREDGDLRSKADLQRATQNATGTVAIVVPERGKGKRIKRTGLEISTVRDAEGNKKTIMSHLLWLPKDRHELSGVLEEYKNNAISLPILIPTTMMGMGLTGKGKGLTGLGGALLGISMLGPALNVHNFGKIKRELEKDPNLSDAEREYLKRQQRRNFLIPALTAAAGLMGGAGLGAALRS